MNNYYLEKLKMKIPCVEKYSLEIERGRTGQFAKFCNQNLLEWDEELASYIPAGMQFLTNNGSSEKHRVVIVSEDKNIAMKFALFVMLYQPCEADDDVYFYYDEDDEEQKVLRIIDFEKKQFCDDKLSNPYLLRHTLRENVSSGTFFAGFSEEDIEQKLDVVEACVAEKVYIYIKPEQKNSQFLRELLSRTNYDIVEIEATDYYEQIADYLNDGKCGPGFAAELKNKLGDSFCEEAMATFLDRPYLFESVKPEGNEADNLVGLNDFKEVLEEFAGIIAEEKSNPKLSALSKHMVFYGNPGTGKTMSAKLLMEIMKRYSGKDGAFVMASRDRIIGKYVGHTAHNVADLFEQARNGVLFVDEAGFFLNKDAGGYVFEAIKEFVRFMEEYRDVTVVFAMYKSELRDFLKLDNGLTSRISRFVKFADYNSDELKKIAQHIACDNGYELSIGAVSAIGRGISAIKKATQEGFGNARVARQIVEGAIVALAVRKIKTGITSQTIEDVDVKAALKKIKHDELATNKNSFGFYNFEGGKENGYKSDCI